MRKLAPGFTILGEVALPVAGTLEGVWADARVYAKFDDPARPGMLWREMVASRLASACGLPVPPGDLAIGSGDRRAWVTAMIAVDGEEPPPVDPARLARENPSLAASVLVFDAWIGNVDRHDGNMLFAPTIGAWLIDHDWAFCGVQPEQLGKRRSEANVHMLRDLELDRTQVQRWIDQLHSTPKASIMGAVREAQVRGLLNAGQRDSVVSWLWGRRERLPVIVKEYWSGRDVVAAVDDGDGGALWSSPSEPGS